MGLAAGLVCTASPAMAGDIAAFQSIGFSKDGGVYAFEEYGVQDGSGFAYSNIYLIDTVKDTYLPGTPIRVRIDDESSGLSQARDAAMQKARPLISELKLADYPGSLVAYNPVSEVGVAKHEMRYLAYPADPAFGEPYELKIEEFSTEPSGACAGVVDDVKAFRLRLTEKDGMAVDQLIHQDVKVPASRGCAVGYRLGGAITYTPPSGSNLHIALVHVLSVGFEGHDGRWLAVPVRP